MTLGELILDVDIERFDPQFAATVISSLECDSRRVIPGAMFVALRGTTADGADFMSDAIQRGAKVVVGSGFFSGHTGVIFLRVKDPQTFLRTAVKRFYGDPSTSMGVIGVTGTKGKTTVTYLIESVFRAAGRPCGVIGTVNYRYAGKVIESKNTTPGLIDNQRLLADMRSSGAEFCIMEVSSHALDQGRVDLIDFRTAVFTNLASDHLDYHHDREQYFLAKSKLFSGLRQEATAVVNMDDPLSDRLINMTAGKIFRYGIEHAADVTARGVTMDLSGTQFQFISPWGDVKIQTSFIGVYNVGNILAAATACLVNGVPLGAVVDGIANLKNVPGRLDRVDCGQNFFVFIDYAHTEDSLENVLRAVREVTKTRIILVFGCGGDRDKTKRSKMGRVASCLADFSVVTSDNSRSEETRDIIAQIIEGFENENYVVEEDRRLAIGRALREAREGEVVLIAGKGHETYQIFRDRTIEFDEKKIVKELLGC